MGLESRDDRVFCRWKDRRGVLLGSLDGVVLRPDGVWLVEGLSGWDDWTVTTTAMPIGAARAAEVAEAAE
jgi:hypothetical protein